MSGGRAYRDQVTLGDGPDRVSMTAANGGMTVDAAIQIIGAFGSGVTAVAADVTLDDTIYSAFIDATAAPRLGNLPLGSTISAGRAYLIQKTDASGNTVTVTPSGGDLINGAATLALTAQREATLVTWNGTEWSAITIPVGGGGAAAWAAVLALGNTTDGTGANNPTISVGDALQGSDTGAGIGNPIILHGGTGPGGVGAIQVDAAGNARGLEAVDFQRTRSSATQVASGDYAFVAGGRSNRAAGAESFAANSFSSARGQGSVAFAGGSTDAAADSSFAIGFGALVYDSYSFGFYTGVTPSYIYGYGAVLFGSEASADGDHTFVHGYGSTADGDNAVAMGFRSEADGNRSMAVNDQANAVGTAAFAMNRLTDALGDNSLAGGNGSSTGVSGDQSISFGTSCQANAADSIVIGNANIGAGIQSALFGQSCQNSAAGSHALTSGRQAFATVPGQRAFSAGRLTSGGLGVSQGADYELSTVTTNATPTALRARAALLVLRTDTGYAFRGTVTAYDATGAGIISGWEVFGVIKDRAGTVSLTGSTVTLMFQDAGAAAWVVAITAGATSLEITVTGAIGVTINWTCALRISEAGI